MRTFRIWKALCCIFVLLAKFIDLTYWWTSLIVVHMCCLRGLSSWSLSRGDALILGGVGDHNPSIELKLLKWYLSGMKVLLIWFRPDRTLISWLWPWRRPLIIFIQRSWPLWASPSSLFRSIGALSGSIWVELHSEWLRAAMIAIAGQRLQMRGLHVVRHASI